MLRTVALVLLLANGLLLAAQWGAFDKLLGNSAKAQQREPERLQKQANPERVQILSPQAAQQALAAAAAAASAAAAPACVEAGPFSQPEAEAADRALREAGVPAGLWVARRSEGGGQYLIYMGRYINAEVALRKLDEVHRRNVEAQVLRTPPELQPGLDLGRFGNRLEAEAALGRMLQKGVRSAKVLTLKAPQPLITWRIAAADGALRTKLTGLRLPSGPGFVACPDAPAPAQAARPASAPAASAAAVVAASAAALPASASSR
jgi:hypothetical protein